MREVRDSVTGRLQRESSNWTRPEIHSPNMREGEISNLPIFPNPAYDIVRQIEAAAKKAEEERIEREQAEAAARKAEQEQIEREQAEAAARKAEQEQMEREKTRAAAQRTSLLHWSKIAR